MADCRPAKCFYIGSLSCEKVLDVKGDKASAGSPVILFDRKAEINPNQLWYEDEHGILRSKLNGYVMDSSGILAILKEVSMLLAVIFVNITSVNFVLLLIFVQLLLIFEFMF